MIQRLSFDLNGTISLINARPVEDNLVLEEVAIYPLEKAFHLRVNVLPSRGLWQLLLDAQQVYEGPFFVDEAFLRREINRSTFRIIGLRAAVDNVTVATIDESHSGLLLSTVIGSFVLRTLRRRRH